MTKEKAANLPIEQQLIGAVHLFTRLRWIPAAVIALSAYPLRHWLGLDVYVLEMWQLALWIVAYNLYLIRRQEQKCTPLLPDLLRCANLNMVLDFTTLILLVHLTGGVLSPLIWFFSLHMILGAIFFTRAQAARMAVLVWLVLVALLLLEHYRIVPPRMIFSPRWDELYYDTSMLFAVTAAAGTLWGALIWLISAIMQRVRDGEQRELDLRSQISHTLDELTASEQKRKLYRRSMTHEMRSPLAAAQSLLKVMATGALGPLSDRQLDSMTRVGKRIDQMFDIIADLLTLERSNHTQAQIGPVALGPLADKLLETSRPSIEERALSVELDIDERAIALGSGDDIEIILSNLISNAVKYNRSGGHLRVSAKPGRGTVIVEVADSGIGIPEKEHPKLFTEFHRAPNAKQLTVQGTGLGLAIVKSLVEINKGTIHLASVENEGTTVTVVLRGVD